MPAAPLTTTITTIIVAAATTTPSAAPSGAAAVPFGAWLAIGFAGTAVIAGLATLSLDPSKEEDGWGTSSFGGVPDAAARHELRVAARRRRYQKDTPLCIISENIAAPAVAADPKRPAAPVVVDPKASGAANPSSNMPEIPSLEADGIRFLLAPANFRLAPTPQERSEDDPGRQHPRRQRWMSRMAERAAFLAKDSKGQ
ncbi:uncharacterized protein N7459_003388 [Penicillium hispanicum]|uniref:uncharacterized protein n=1 Tax=Penicillium hispanicum TaxID=1080232 RepID=UPI00254143BF|nr:uncharacterized protein N7459_003388 [Penicillium hispanicum]KAJ5587623.1 hypothetical protein N7459_003388 [Penicillium hispanicum]